MTTPWATGAWATSGWAGATSPIALSSAYAVSMNEVQVNATGNMLQRSIVLAGDSSNPSSWRIVRGDNNQIVPVVAVETVAGNASAVVLRTLFPLPSYGVTMTVYGLNLRDSLGALVVPPTSLTFTGLVEVAYQDQGRTAVTMTRGAVDLLNRQTPSNAGSLTGALVVQGGDYQNQTGTDLLKKLIIRRVTASPSDFLHLPGYGVGLLTKCKDIIPLGELPKLQQAIAQQVMQETDVASVNITLLQSSNQLTVQVQALVKSTGESLEFGVPFQTQGGAGS